MLTKQKEIRTFADLPKIVAFDFDGTLVEDKFPEIGTPDQYMFKLAQDLQNSGVKIILWTSRNNDSNLGELLDAATYFCYDRFDLEFDAVNTNIKEVKELTGADTRKIYADLYIDDKSIPHNQHFLYWIQRLGMTYQEFIYGNSEKHIQDVLGGKK